jgi:L-fuculose-phosphate aldolase
MEEMHARYSRQPMDLAEARRDVVIHAQKMWRAGLVVGTAGNVSRRVPGNCIAVTPSSVPYEVLSGEDIAIVDLATGETVESSGPPSYELPMHLAIYRSRHEVQAIVHTHSPFVTTLSILRRPLPPVIDEMIIYFGGPVEVADYAFTGTDAVGLHALRALGDRTACILANHGNVCVGRDLDQALHLAMVMETCAQVYVQALSIGEPAALPRESIAAGRHLYETRTKL